MRFEVNGEPIEAEPRAGPVPADAAARDTATRGQEGLRRRRLRRVQRAPRRRARALVHHPGRAGRGRARSRRPRASRPATSCTRCRRRSSSTSGSSAGSARPGMAVTASTLDGRRPARPRPAHEGQPVPVHGLPPDPRRDHAAVLGPGARDRAARQARRRTPGRARSSAGSVPRPTAASPHRRRAGEPFTFDASCRDSSPSRSTPTAEALVLRVARLAARARPHRRRSTRRRRRAVPGVVAVFTHDDVAARAATRPRGTSTARTTPTTPACSTTSCATSGSGSPPSSPRRPRPPTRRCRLIDVEYDVLPAVFDPEEARAPGRTARAPATCTPDDRVAEASRNVIAALHDGIGGDVDAALAASAVTGRRGTWQTQRVIARAARDPRLDRLARRRRPARHPLEHAGAVPHARRARARSSTSTATACASSRRASAAASAASRRSSPRTSSRSPCCAPAAPWRTSSRARTSSGGRRCGIRCGSRCRSARRATACSPR